MDHVVTDDLLHLQKQYQLIMTTFLSIRLYAVKILPMKQYRLTMTTFLSIRSSTDKPKHLSTQESYILTTNIHPWKMLENLPLKLL